MLALNRRLGEVLQRVTSAKKASSPKFQAWLRYKNATGSDIYIGMNPLRKHASTRKKEDIQSTRRAPSESPTRILVHSFLELPSTSALSPVTSFRADVTSFMTIPRWLKIFWNSAVAS